MLDFLVIVAVVIVLGFGLWWLSYPVRMSYANKPAMEYAHTLKSAGSSSEEKFPSIFDEPSVTLSVIVPAYNEEERLPIMLDQTIAQFEKKKSTVPRFTYEIIVGGYEVLRRARR